MTTISYDGTGRIHWMGGDIYRYDRLGRVTQAAVTEPDGEAWSYGTSYDAFGSVTALSAVGPGTNATTTIPIDSWSFPCHPGSLAEPEARPVLRSEGRGRTLIDSTGGAMKHVLLSLLVAMMLTASAVSADDAKHEFRVRLDRIEEPILAGDYEKARAKAVQLEQDMVHRILAGPKVREYLGSIATLHAISLAGVGELDHAAWKWAMAREIQPATDLGTLERFGSVGPRGHEISILTLLPARHRHGSGVGHGRDRR